MKIGLFLALYADRPLEEALDAAVAAGCESVEIVSGASELPLPARRASRAIRSRASASLALISRSRSDDLGALVSRRTRFTRTPTSRAAADRAYRDTVRLAAELGRRDRDHLLRLPRRVRALAAAELGHLLVAGRLSGDARLAVGETGAARTGSRRPRSPARTGSASRSSRIPGFVVYNTARCCGCARARATRSGVNFDPSHLFWQGMDPLACVRALGEAIFHVHAKDTGFQTSPLAVNGVLETIPGDRPGSEAGSSAPSARAIPSPSGASSSARCGGPATTERSRSSTRTRCSRGRKVSRSPSRRCARRSIPRWRLSAEVVVGLDVGTTGVKAIAVAPDGRSPRVAEQGYPLSTPRAGLVGAGSRGLVARDARRCSRGSPELGGARDRRHRALGPDARPRRPRCRRIASSGPRSSGTTSAPAPSAPRSRSGSASSG